MSLKSVLFESDEQAVPEIDADLVAKHRSQIERRILSDGPGGTPFYQAKNNPGIGVYRTDIVVPFVGRFFVLWIEDDTETARVVAVRPGDAFVDSPDDADDYS